MARILIVTTGIASIAFSQLEVARRLRSVGHQIEIASQDPIRALVESHDLPFIQLHGDAPHVGRTYYRQGSTIAKCLQLVGKLFTIRRRRAAAIAAFEIDHFLRAFSKVDPDLCIIDVEMHAHAMAVSSRRTPVLISSNFLSVFRYEHVPPLHIYATPDQNSEQLWQTFLRWKRWIRTLEIIRTVGEDRWSIINALGRRLGFAVKKELDADQWPIPYLFRTIPVLSLSSIALDFPRAAAPNEYHVGPMVLSDRPFRRLDEPSRVRLEMILSQRARDGGRPLIYCAFGAQFQGDDHDFVAKVLTAARSLPDVDFVVGLGDRLMSESFEAHASNIAVFDWVPQLEVLQTADAAVVHAGLSTLHECILAGVPMLVYPFWNVVDQSGNAARIEYRGLGLIADRDQDPPDMIAARMMQLLDDQQIRSAVDAMRHTLELEQRECRLERIIAQTLQSHETPLDTLTVDTKSESDDDI